MLRHTDRLNRFGLLHEDLAPFLWPAQDESLSFWEFVRVKGKRERDLWSRNIVSTKDDASIAFGLLQGFNLLGGMDSIGLHVAPGVLPPALLPRQPTSYLVACPFNLEITYAALPAGAFHSIVVRISKQGSVQMEAG